MNKYVLAIDQGTTSSRVIIFDKDNNIITSSQLEVGIICKHSGWVEQNALEIWETVYECLKMVITDTSIDPLNIVSIGITNQRETTIIWDKITGEPLCNAIVWQSRQSQSICEKWINNGYTDLIKEKTGLIINPYFSASKIRFMIDNNPFIEEKILKGEALFGTVDSYLVWKLTEGKAHITDMSNASRTMLFNIKEKCWDEELLDLFNIPKSILPIVKSSSEEYGKATILKNINKNLNVPITAVIGDQQASLFGQCCFNAGDVKNTYGTGCFMLMNTKDLIVNSNNGLLTTIAWNINGETEYALEGSVFVGGSAVQWLRDGMRMIEKSKDVEKYSLNQGSNGVYVVPAFVGLGTPYWDNDARGSVFGLTRNTTKENFINATVESIAYQSKDVMEVMKEEAGLELNTLSVDGGASGNNYLMKFQADISNCKIMRPKCLETTALGAAYLSGLAVGFWKSKNELVKLHKTEQIFMPTMESEERDKLYEGWKKAIKATMTYK